MQLRASLVIFLFMQRLELAPSRSINKKATDNSVAKLPIAPIKKWRRRESNPRPNKEPKSFLHAYSVINPLAQNGHRQPNLLPQSLKFRTITETHIALSLLR